MTKAERILLICEKEEKGNMSKFARRTGVTPAYISKLKNKPDSDPSDIFVREVSRQYGANETWILTGEGDMNAPQSREQEIAEITSQLYEADPEGLQYKFIKALSKLEPEIWEQIKNFMDSLQ